MDETPSKLREDHSLKAYNGIRRMLYLKKLVPGQKIAYRELAEQLKMSPTPIVQALKWLELQGFVRHEPNRGYSMAPISLKELEEIYELRELLEPSLLPATIARVDQEGIAALKSALEAHLSAEREVYLKERLFKNREFHLTLASLSGKDTQFRMLQQIFDLLSLKYGGNTYLPPPTLQSMDHEHMEVYSCVIARDSEGARKILEAHIRSMKEQVLEIYRRVLAEEERPEF
jgi:DNA-binding GntR family transcriptional regulator